MKKYLAFIFMFFCWTTIFSQERFLNYASKDSVLNEPKVRGYLGVNLKLNGYYDVFGGLQNSETFNVGSINVFGTDDSSSLKVDLYQTQIIMASSFMTKKGGIDAYVDFDFWGGNGKMRLRQAYVTFNNWLIGQSWVQYGDDELWPDIMEWEGPPSGIWVRAPQITYKNTLKNENYIYTLSITAPIVDYVRYGELEPLVEEANQTIPDFTAALKYQNIWGHIRLSSIFRNVNYTYENETNSFFGYGFAFSGIYIKNLNNFQFQLTAGKGVSAYNTSVQGFGYDGYPTANGQIDATPSYGGWASYEFFYSPKFHSTLVFGYTGFFLNNAQRVIIDQETISNLTMLNGNVDNYHYYGIVNLMYDPIEQMTFGVELDYGNKKLLYDGTVNDAYINNTQARDAMRISFGFMYAF